MLKLFTAQNSICTLKAFLSMDVFDSPPLSEMMLSVCRCTDDCRTHQVEEPNLNKPSQKPSTPGTTAEPSLNARLAARRAETSRVRPDFARAYDLLVERLARLDRGEVGPQVGEPMPPFDLPDAAGHLVSLDSLLRSGPAVISINRGHWCPYCKIELRSLAAVQQRIETLGARFVSIMPDSAQYTSEYAVQNDLQFPILSDIDLGYTLSLGLMFWVGSEVQQLYKDAGVELAKYHDNQGSFLPVAAKFIVGRDGLVKARHVNVEFRQRMEPEAIIAALEMLQGR